MDTMDKTQQFNRTIPCSNCGEMYSVTYKRCPFCGGPPPRKRPEKSERPERAEWAERSERPERDEQTPKPEEPAWAEWTETPQRDEQPEKSEQAEPVVERALWPERPEWLEPMKQEDWQEIREEVREELRSDEQLAPDEVPVRQAANVDRGGRRLKSEEPRKGTKSGSSPGRVLIFFLSLAIIVAAIYIAVTKAYPIIQARFGDGSSQQDPDGSGDPAQTPGGVGGEGDGVVGFGISEVSVVLVAPGQWQKLELVYDPGEELGALLWSSSAPDVASVDQEGMVTAVGLGNAVITVTKGDGAAAQCEVQCVWDSSGSAINSTFSLNKVDFTLGPNDPDVTMKVIGTDETPVWTSANPNIATISENGVVKYVSSGNTTVTATIGGKSQSCIVRCT